jgi:hypothetical protein
MREAPLIAPAYLAPATATVVAWARREAARVAGRYDVPLTDAWDAAVSALVRAEAYFQPGANTFTRYAKLAVTRGLRRYCGLDGRRRANRPGHVRATDPLAEDTWAAHTASAEEVVAAIEAVERAAILRAHAQIADGRRDALDACRLRDAARAAARTTRHPPRP